MNVSESYKERGCPVKIKVACQVCLNTLLEHMLLILD